MSTTGVTYYKLENGYPGDVTKGCGLSGSEIDKNFHFLRGYDVRDGEISNGKIILNRVSGEEIVIDGLNDFVANIADGRGVKVTVDEEGSYFDKDRFELHIALNYALSGETGTTEDFVISGFRIEHDRVYVGDGLYGNGNVSSPITLNPIHKTGFYKSVNAFIDCTKEGNSLPEDKGDGDRYLTKEKISKIGLEYLPSVLEDISRRLETEGKGWRIPTVDDWNGLLNGAEDCDWQDSHGSSTNSGYYGKDAGFRLKNNEWNEERFVGNGFNVVPTEEGTLGMVARFWSSTTDKIKEITRKVFTQNDGRVFQEGGANRQDNWASIRLVRDYDDRPVLDAEEIDGTIYNCSGFTYILNGVETRKIWTLENVSFSRYLQDGTARVPLLSTEEEDEYAYYINEYNAELGEWLKKKLEPNDCLVIKEYEGEEPNSEFILMPEGVLENRTKLIMDGVFEGVQVEIDRLDAKIDDETERAKNAEDKLDEEIERIKTGLTEVVAIIDEEISQTNDRIDSLIDDVSALTQHVDEQVDRLDNKLNEEVARVDTRIDNEIADRKANDLIYENITVGPNLTGELKNSAGKKMDISFEGNYSEYNPNDQEDGWSIFECMTDSE